MVDLEASGATILLIHDGELADVRELLDALGLGFDESLPTSTSSADYRDAAIAIAGPQYLLDRLDAGDPSGAVRIAILEGEARTLRSMLSRGGIEWMVRRPFHPTALRLLLLHCIYQGPEKRSGRRVSVGAAIHFQCGWRKRGALLAEISERDCRFLSERALAVGKRVKLRLPSELVGRRALALEGRVVRTAEAREAAGSHEVCVVFDALGSSEALRLKQLVAVHARGPALLAGATARHIARSRSEDPSEERRFRRSVISVGAGVVGAADDADSPDDSGEPEIGGQQAGVERRRDPRHAFPRRVIALGDEATRVLVGRDISLRGMRVDPSPELQLGKTLQIAIHVSGNETPLVVSVRVERDDGERGVLMSFEGLSPTATRYLEEMLDGLSGVSAGAEDAGIGRAAVVSEILPRG